MEKSISISLKGLSKYYGEVRGLESVTMEVLTGEIFGLLGPNGSGKTTCLRLILGMLKPNQGTVQIFGQELKKDPWRFKERIGNLPADVEWWPELSGHEILTFFGRFRPLRPPVLRPHLVERFGLDTGLLSRKVRTYSRGTRKKLGLVAAMQHDPDLLILDEPSSGLDPLVRRSLFDLLLDFKARGKTVLLSSHTLSEAQQVCDRLGMVGQGRLFAVEPIGFLREENLRKVEVWFQDPQDAKGFSLENAEIEEQTEMKVTFRYRGAPSALIQALSEIPLADLIIAPPSLEDQFLRYYGQEIQEENSGGEA